MPVLQRPPTRLPKSPDHVVGAVLLLIAFLLSPGLSAARAATLEETVRAAAGRDYIHGMTAAIAAQEVGEAGVPILLDLLADPGFPRRDNVVAFLTYLGGDRTAQAILRFLRDPPASILVPEEDRALLLAPQALGHIASRGHGAALRALLAMTADGARGDVLARGAMKAAAPEALRDDLLEMALRGLAFCNDDVARARIRDIAEGRIVPAAGGRPLAKAARSAGNLSRSLTAAPAPEASAGEPIVGMQLLATDPSTDAHEHRIDYANHVDHDDPMTDARLDQVFAEAVALVGFSDFAEDVSCCVTFVRKGAGQTFGTPGDGLDVVDDFWEQFTIEAVNIARFKVVRIINFCGMPGTNIIGCGGFNGATITVVRKTALTSEAILWVHEYGHNVAIGHNPDSRFIMAAANTGSNNGVSAGECDKYHNPGFFSQADISVIGACVAPVCGNSTCDLAENCNNCPGDCISGGGFCCGDLVCEGSETSFNCAVDCGAPVQTTWAFYGMAEGGTIDFTISGVALQIVTTAGESNAQIAIDAAAAINDDPTLSAMGVTASSAANFVTTDGSMDAITINDPGLSHGPPEIPALPATGLGLSVLLLVAALLLARRRRA